MGGMLVLPSYLLLLFDNHGLLCFFLYNNYVFIYYFLATFSRIVMKHG